MIISRNFEILAYLVLDGSDGCLDNSDGCLDNSDGCLDNSDRCLDIPDKSLNIPEYINYREIMIYKQLLKFIINYNWNF